MEKKYNKTPLFFFKTRRLPNKMYAKAMAYFVDLKYVHLKIKVN